MLHKRTTVYKSGGGGLQSSLTPTTMGVGVEKVRAMHMMTQWGGGGIWHLSMLKGDEKASTSLKSLTMFGGWWCFGVGPGGWYVFVP